jgi:hypothetical protein
MLSKAVEKISLQKVELPTQFSAFSVLFIDFINDVDGI